MVFSDRRAWTGFASAGFRASGQTVERKAGRYPPE